ncbi:MAG: F0F1 ATP synthase subunit epsilon [Phycisphaerales bacterium]|nr:F0F1 ATP synthase subunit epsilon [Phycisphaerales bacterium]
MATKTFFRTKLITPDAQVLDEPTKYVSIPAWDGSIGFLPGRAPIVAKLGIGELRLDFADGAATGGSGSKERGGSRSFLVEDGFAHMVGDTLTILASKATPAETITEASAQAELAEAQARKTEGVADPALVTRIRKQREAATKKLTMARAFRTRGGAI